jgi:hypothetical protein
MSRTAMESVISALKDREITIEHGLTAEECAATERRYGFSFPPDLREFLSCGLPVPEDFPNWRTGKIQRSRTTTEISELLDWPCEGMCFDIENNEFWMPDWGPRPSDLPEAFQLARRMVRQAPPLIPVFSHRFLPAEPPTEGNPVLSVWQTDIIYYGPDLISYFAEEFDLPAEHCRNSARDPRRIRF